MTKNKRKGSEPIQWRAIQVQGLAIMSMLVLCCNAHARNEWFTTRTYGPETKPISQVNGKLGQIMSAMGAQGKASVDSGYLDIVICLHNDPQGDNDGNTQSSPPSDQDVYEQIIQCFADGVYEATEGAHRLRRVRIYRNGQNADIADVVWSAKGHPHVPHKGGIGESGGHINMYDVFENGLKRGTNYQDYDLLTDLEGAGYTLAHEWGHYAYGVYDEYKLQTTDVPVEPSIMNSQWRASGGQYRWLNFSIANAGGGDFQNTLLNNQHRKHDASAWETLARLVANDSLTADQLPLGRRIYYPEIVAVAPATNAMPRIDLPNSAARSALDIQWQSSNIVIQVVIDRSGSMSGTKISNAKAAAKLLVDQVQLGSSVVGVVKFDNLIEVAYPLTAVTSDAVKSAIKAAIDTITARNNTALFGAADAALTGLLNLQTSNDTKVMFLLTDGVNTAGPGSPDPVISRCQAAQIPMFTFGYGNDVDAGVLQRMATETGGRYYFSPTALADISRAFNDAFVVASAQVGVDEGTATAGPSPQTNSFEVDATLKVLNVNVIQQGSPSDVSLQLLSPTGSSIAPASTSQSGGETAYFFSVNNPTPGTWQLVSSSVLPSRSVNFQIIGVPSELTVAANLISVNGSSITAPEPMILRARLEQGLPIAGANVAGEVKRPDGSVAPVVFHDDGVAPDDLAGDGIYSLRFNYAASGAYQFTVRFDNAADAAQFVFEGAILSAPKDETDIPPLPQPVPVGIAFNRSASRQVVVSGAMTVSVSVLSSTTTTLIDRQTGLFYQTLVLTNEGSTDINGLRLTVDNLLAGVVLVGATGTNGTGQPYLDVSQTVPAGGLVTNTLSFYAPDRTAPAPITDVEALSVSPPAVVAGAALSIDRAYLRPDGKMVVEFATSPGRNYFVEYSSDMVTWKQVLPPITATGTWFVWVDAGPPFTESPPVAGNRFYRIVLLP